MDKVEFWSYMAYFIKAIAKKKKNTRLICIPVICLCQVFNSKFYTSKGLESLEHFLSQRGHKKVLCLKQLESWYHDIKYNIERIKQLPYILKNKNNKRKKKHSRNENNERYFAENSEVPYYLRQPFLMPFHVSQILCVPINSFSIIIMLILLLPIHHHQLETQEIFRFP